MRKILFASSEVHPLVKTGGLADVSASLPIALKEKGEDVRIIIPAYRQCLAKLTDIVTIATIKLDGYHTPVQILKSKLPDSDVPLYLLHSPEHFDRDGGPYGQVSGEDWDDNPARFALFSRAIANVAMDGIGENWQPDVLHCNDWQTGLALPLIEHQPQRPATVFTIHNLAYQGLYSRAVFDALDLPESLWHSEGLEFYDLMSFMKGGLIYADHITTVSPTYAEEICSDEFGYGLQGLLSLRARQHRLTGILNGIDVEQWNPETDRHIVKRYSTKSIRDKRVNKMAIQREFGLPSKHEAVLFGFISRLVSQKGIDLSLLALEQLLVSGEAIQVVCLGSGEAEFEQGLRILRARYPDRVGVEIGYDEALSHRIEAGVDVFLMPSRFEPCGLNQLYSLRYGTLPLVRNTGGLADTVVDATDENRKLGIATGFKFEQSTEQELEQSLHRVVNLFKRPRIWRKMMITAMTQDFSWAKSAQTYQDLYQHIT